MILKDDGTFIPIPSGGYWNISEIIDRISDDDETKQLFLKQLGTSVTLKIGNETFTIPPNEYPSFLEILKLLNLTPNATDIVEKEIVSHVKMIEEKDVRYPHSLETV